MRKIKCFILIAAILMMNFTVFAVGDGEVTVIGSEDFKSIKEWQLVHGSGFDAFDGNLVYDNKNHVEKPAVIQSDALSIENGELEFDLSAKKGRYFGLLFRMNGESTFYSLRFYFDTGKIMLLKRIKGGSYTDISRCPFGLEYNTDYKVQVTLKGSEIQVRINGKSVIEAKDRSIKAGNIGFEANSITAMVGKIDIFKYNDVFYDIVEKDENAKEAAVIYVAPEGNAKSANGSAEYPYINIDDAREAVKTAKKGNTPVDVVFLGGTYKISETVKLTGADSGTAEAPIRYMAKPGDKVVFSGAKRLDTAKFTQVSGKMVNRIHQDAKGRVLQLNLKEQNIPKKLVDYTAIAKTAKLGDNLKPPIIALNGASQSLARWPNSGYLDITSCVAGSSTEGGKIFYSQINPTRWTQAEDMFVEGFFSHFWHGEWIKVKQIDTQKNSIEMLFPTQYNRIVDGHRWAAVNLIEELDIPGEWYIDIEEMMLYYYPPHELTENDSLEIAALDKNLLEINGAENLTVEGIEFTMSASDQSTKSINSALSNAVYVAKGSKNITIKNCVINKIGMNGIVIMSDNVLIDGCRIYDIAFNGIYCDGIGNLQTLTPSNVVIQNCDISDVCRATNKNAFAGIVLKTNTTGVIIKNNIIHDCPNSAIRYAGCDHSILYNEIYNSVTMTADAGAIYAGRNWCEYGTKIQYNYFHDIGQENNSGNYPASSLFLDDYQAGTEFSYNISVVNNLIKTSSVKIGGGVDNIVHANIMATSEYDIIGEDRSTSQVIDWPTFANNTLNLRRVPYTSPIFRKKHPQMSTLLDRIKANDGILKLENTITDNLSADCTSTRVASTMLEASEYSGNVFLKGEDDVFVSPENQDYRVKASAKEKYNISDDILDESFDLNTIGLQNGYRLDAAKIEFSSVYPFDGQSGIQTKDVVLAWTRAPFADEYRYSVALDREFINIVSEGVTKFENVVIDGLKNNTKFYWRVEAVNTSRQLGTTAYSLNGVRAFETSPSDTLETELLENKVSAVRELLKTIEENELPGRFAVGTSMKIEAMLSEAQKLINEKIGIQSAVDDMTYKISNILNNIDSYKNIGYKALNIGTSSDWFSKNENTAVIKSADSVRFELGGQSPLSLMETLENTDIACFRLKMDSLSGTWAGFGLRVLDKEKAIYSQSCYYAVIKENIFELQNHGTIYLTVPNNGIFEAGRWYDIQLGAIPTEKGINMLFIVDGKVIFDYLDTSTPQNTPGMFALYSGKAGNGLELAKPTEMPDTLYSLSPEIIAQIKGESGTTTTLGTADSAYSEVGAWTDNGDGVRKATENGASAKWIMNSGMKGNGKLFKVSYYHIPKENGDKNVSVKLIGYAGEYSTTVDLSTGEEGYVELGTFKFMDADSTGRLSAVFKGSGQGEINISNIKFEMVDSSEYVDMLK